MTSVVSTQSTAVESLVISEVFGPTFQGEGQSAGRHASFVRLGGCDLHCSWCDSSYTWDSSRFDLRVELARRPVAAILQDIADRGATLTVLTGGEPLLHQQQPGWGTLLRGLTARGRELEIETNGTRAPTPETLANADRFTVSPKLAHAGDPLGKRIRPGVLSAFRDSGKATFKFVVATEDDLLEVDHLVATIGIAPGLLWIMPEGINAEVILARARELADAVLQRGYNFSSRLHVLLWADERKR